MDSRNAQRAIDALERALDRKDTVGAYLAAAAVLGELLALCYDGEVPPLEERFSRLGETPAGARLLPNFEAYARLCIRLDGAVLWRVAGGYPQVTDARRLLRRILEG